MFEIRLYQLQLYSSNQYTDENPKPILLKNCKPDHEKQHHRRTYEILTLTYPMKRPV
jgi:hypothetical protein